MEVEVVEVEVVEVEVVEVEVVDLASVMEHHRRASLQRGSP